MLWHPSLINNAACHKSFWERLQSWQRKTESLIRARTMQIYTFARHSTHSNCATVPVAVEPGGQDPRATRRLCDRHLVGRQESNYVVCRVPGPTGRPAKDVALCNYRPLHVLSLLAKIVRLHPSSLCPSRPSRPDLSYRPISTETSGLLVFFFLFSCMCVCIC